MSREGKGLGGVTVAILAGGLGTRIRAQLGETPKVLAPINGRPFLDHLADFLARQGAGKLVLCLGFLADKVEAHLASRSWPLAIETVTETEPLGTGGALRLARPLLDGEAVLVMNGDTWIDADFGAFLAAHRQSRRPVSLLCVAVADVSRYGRLELAADGALIRFVEKDPEIHGPGLINAGAYLFSQAALDELAAATGPSLERDFLQTRGLGAIGGHVAQASFIDIGTPQSLAEAPSVLPEAKG